MTVTGDLSALQRLGFSIAEARLIMLVETNLHTLARAEELTAEQAICLKQRFSLPIGVLNQRFQLRTETCAKRKKGVDEC